MASLAPIGKAPLLIAMADLTSISLPASKDKEVERERS